MQYFISFLEGIITFISPCLLPMLPVYISYFMGGEENKNKALKNSLGFVLGFTVVFVSLGIFASTFGVFLSKFQTAVNIISGLIVILFGLNYMGILRIGILNKSAKIDFKPKNLGFFSSFQFGIVFSIGWTPCVGAFLGSALILASQQGSIVQGIFMLLAYSVGLAIPFVLSAVMIDKMKGALDFVKRNYKIINIISGAFLVVMGIMMATGAMGYLLRFLSF